MSDSAWIGVDIGGTNTVIGVFDSSLRLLVKRSMPTLTYQGPGRTSDPADFLDMLAEVVRAALQDAGAAKARGAGFGVPGWVDPEKGIARSASNMGWRDVPFGEGMRARLGMPVAIDNDVRMYALGESLAGAGRGSRNLLCVTLGTGLAAGLLIDGKPVSGGHHFAGEIGHDPVEGWTVPCKCGRIGCLETIASATGIARLASEAAAKGKSAALAAEARHAAEITALDAYRAAVRGDAGAIGVFRQVGEVLARKLMTWIALVDPDTVIIGGGAAQAGDLLLEPIRSFLDAQYTVKERMPLIRTGTLGDTAGLIGSVHVAAGRSGSG